MEILHLFLRRHFERKPLGWQNVGCFSRLGFAVPMQLWFIFMAPDTCIQLTDIRVVISSSTSLAVLFCDTGKFMPYGLKRQIKICFRVYLRIAMSKVHQTSKCDKWVPEGFIWCDPLIGINHKCSFQQISKLIPSKHTQIFNRLNGSCNQFIYLL